MIINIDKALELRSDYNILKEPLNAMLKNQQEAWEKSNPIDLLFVRGTLNSFQETYTSSIGFNHAFAETSDYAVGPIFNTAEGFSATYRSRTFQGGFIITQQVLEDGQMGRVKDDANAFIKRWHGDIVEYAMTAIDSGFGVARKFEDTKLQLFSADTTDGVIDTPTKNPLFCKTHKTVKTGDRAAIDQSNLFSADIDLMSDDPGVIVKLADAINQAITYMENYRDDNGKRAGVLGAKTIVAANDPHLKAAINTALSMDRFNVGESMMLNPAKERATAEFTPYLSDIEACKEDATKKFSRGFFIVDKSYNEANHGPELTERVALTLDVNNNTSAPKGIKYEGRQRFDINVASWRGISYVYLGTPVTDDANAWNHKDKFTALNLVKTAVTPVNVVNTVSTKEQA